MFPRILVSRQWQVTWAISKRVILAAVFGPTLYIGLAIIVFAAIIPIRSFDSILNNQGAVVVTRPFDISIMIACILIAIYLAFFSLLAITQERDQGTMDVLFFGPIDPQSYILGQFVGQWLQSALLFLIFGLYLILLSQITGLVSTWQLGISLITSSITSATVISFGIFLGIIVRRTKGAILVFASLIVLIVGLQTASSLLSDSVAQGLINSGFLLSILHGLNSIVGWISPFSYLFNGLGAASRGDYTSYLLALGQAIIYMLILISLSTYVLKRRGIRS